MKKVVLSLLVVGMSFIPTASFAVDFLTPEEESLTTSSSECWSDVQSFKYDVVGESHRKPNVEQVLGDRADWDYPFMISKANLVPEPSNKSDKYAIKVVVSNIHIGYVPKQYSKTMSLYLKSKKATNIPLCLVWDNDSVGYQAFLNMDIYLKSIKKTIPSWRNDRQISL